MSFLLRRGIMSSALAAGGGTFAANTANLNGVDQYFGHADDAIFDITGDITMAIWVKPASTAAGGYISKYVHPAAQKSYLIFHSGGYAYMTLSSNGSSTTDLKYTTLLSVGSWQLIIAKLTSTTMSISVDAGTPVTKSHSGGIFNSTAPLYVGNYADGSGYSNGGLMNAIIWNRALSGAEETELYNGGTPKCYDSMSSGLKSSIVEFWSLENHTGFTGQELTGQVSSKDLTNYNSTPFTGTGLNVECTGTGNDTYAANTANLNGVDQYFTFPTASDTGITGDFTFITWIKKGEANADLMSVWDGPAPFFWRDRPATGGMKVNLNYTGFSWQSTLEIPNDGNWHMALLSRSGSTVSLSVDDGTPETNTYGTAIALGNNLFVFGAYDGGNAYANPLLGSLGYQGAWSRALTGAEITSMYNSGVAKCWNSLSVGEQTSISFYIPLSNHSGFTSQELIDQSSTVTSLTNYNSTPFTGTGLNVECGGTPPVADNYLFLPHITIY